MTSVAHSPGPWRLSNQKTHHDIRDAKGRWLAETRQHSGCDDLYPAPDEAAANARLIAAAPDLYEALEAAVACHMIPSSTASEGGATAHSEQVRTADKIRAALATARGESGK